MALDIYDINSAKQQQQITDRFLSRFRGGNKSGALMTLVSDAVSGMLDRPTQSAPRPSIPSAANASAMGADRTMQFMQMQNQQAQADAARQLEEEKMRAQEEAAEKARQQQIKLEQLRMKNQINTEKFRIESQLQLQELELQKKQQEEARKKFEPFELEPGFMVQRQPDGTIKSVYESPLYKQRQETSRAQQVAAQLRAARGGSGAGSTGGTNVSMQDWDVEERVWNPVTFAYDTVRTRMGYHPRLNRALPVLDINNKPVQVTIPGVPEYVEIVTEKGKFMYPKGQDGRPILTVPPLTAAQARTAGVAVPSPLRDEALVREGGGDLGFQTAPPRPARVSDVELTEPQFQFVISSAYENLPLDVQKKYTVNENGKLVDREDETAIVPSVIAKKYLDSVEAAKAKIRPAQNDGDDDVGSLSDFAAAIFNPKDMITFKGAE